MMATIISQIFPPEYNMFLIQLADLPLNTSAPHSTIEADINSSELLSMKFVKSSRGGPTISRLVSFNIYMCVCVCVCVCLYIYIYIYTYLYMCIYRYLRSAVLY